MDQPILLGVCRRALVHGDGISQDLFQVSPFVGAPFYPQWLGGLKLLFAFPRPMAQAQVPIEITLLDRNEPGRKAAFEVTLVESPRQLDSVRVSGVSHLFRGEDKITEDAHACRMETPLLSVNGSPYILIPVPCLPLLVPEPTYIEVRGGMDNREHLCGGFPCLLAEPPGISKKGVRLTFLPDGGRAAHLVVSSVACVLTQLHLPGAARDETVGRDDPPYFCLPA